MATSLCTLCARSPSESQICSSHRIPRYRSPLVRGRTCAHAYGFTYAGRPGVASLGPRSVGGRTANDGTPFPQLKQDLVTDGASTAPGARPDVTDHPIATRVRPHRGGAPPGRRAGEARVPPRATGHGGRFCHQGERRWGIIGSPHRHALSELAGPARGGHVPPPRRLVGHHAPGRSHVADTRLTGSRSGAFLTPRAVITTPLRARET